MVIRYETHDQFRADLRRIRVEMNYSLRDVEDLSGVHRNTISSWEHGNSTPSIFNAHCVLEALGITLKVGWNDDQ